MVMMIFEHDSPTQPQIDQFPKRSKHELTEAEIVLKLRLLHIPDPHSPAKAIDDKLMDEIKGLTLFDNNANKLDKVRDRAPLGLRAQPLPHVHDEVLLLPLLGGGRGRLHDCF
jgi:hypothetical protein